MRARLKIDPERVIGKIDPFFLQRYFIQGVVFTGIK